MIWSEVEELFGLELAGKMRNSLYLKGVTCSLTSSGELNFEESDILLAFKDVMGFLIGDLEWD